MIVSYLLPLVIFLTPSLSMVAGLIAAPMIVIFLSLTAFSILGSKYKDSFQIFCHALRNDRKKNFYFAIMLFVSWSGLSLTWSINLNTSINVFQQIFLLTSLYFFCDFFIKSSNVSRKNTYALICGIILAIGLFYIEYFFDAVLTRTYNSLYRPSEIVNFYLYKLDRGCSILAISSWIIFAYLVEKKKYLFFILYLLILYLLLISDSLASLVGFSLASIVFCIAKLSKTKFSKIVSFSVISGSITLLAIFYNIAPFDIDKDYKFLPFSAKHRLIIWQYTTHKAQEKILIGHGLGCSKNIQIQERDMIIYHNQLLSPLPLHPHNVIVQIFLELGIVGLMLFLYIIKEILKLIRNFAFVESNFGAAAYACFFNYFIIAMISYNIWQTWWFCAGLWAAIMFKIVYLTVIKEKTASTNISYIKFEN